MILLFFLFILVQSTVAEELNNFSEQYNIMTTIELPSRPSKVSVLTKNNLIKAKYISLKDNKYLISALSNTKPEKFSVVSKIKNQLFFSLIKNYSSIEKKSVLKIEQEIEKLKTEIELESNKYQNLKTELVKELDFKVEDFSRLKSEQKETKILKAVKSNLKRQIKTHKNDSRSIYEFSKIASEHLKKAAKRTTKSIRTSKRRKKAALNKFKKRLKLINSIKNIDFNQLNNELISLRKKRKELENSVIYNQF